MLDDFRNKIAALQQFNWQTEMETIIDSNTDKIVELQRDQMSIGKDRNGSLTTLNGNGYAPLTIKLKQKYGQGLLGSVTEVVTGYMTGKLYSELETKRSGDVINTISSVEYFETLLGRTGDDWMGLDYDKRLEFGEEVTLPEIKESFKNKTGFVIT
jgi:hypothetical protein